MSERFLLIFIRRNLHEELGLIIGGNWVAVIVIPFLLFTLSATAVLRTSGQRRLEREG